MRGSLGSAIVAPILAFVATQHHLIHMLLITAGLGSAGMSNMMLNNGLRRAMLLGSLVMVGLTVRRLLLRHGSIGGRVVSGLSVALTVTLLIWTTITYGL